MAQMESAGTLSALTGMSGAIGVRPQSVPRDVSPLDAAFNTQDCAMNGLSERISQLEERLSPVLQPEMTAQGGDGMAGTAPEPPRSATTSRILSQAETIGYMEQRLRRLIHLLDI